MRLDFIPLDEVVPAFRNPKDHDVGAIMESIRRFGFVSPAVMNEATGKLVAGHGRLEALRLLWNEGGKPPKGIKVAKNGGWKIPVIRGISFESDEEAEAYLIADNRLTELGGWDESQLADALKDLAAYNREAFEITGFDDDDLGQILANLEGVTQGPQTTGTSGQARTCPSCGEELP